jgi:shikimate dehydrogenase
MRLYGLIGYPLTHSFSKKYFTEKFEKEAISGHAYELFELDSISFLPSEVLDKHPSLCGLNVTIPYKEAVISFLDDNSHLPLPACNCIKITNGKLKGFNTDIVGFEQSLRVLWEPKHTPALVLGTGGAAIAVCYVLQKIGIPFKQVSRSAKKADLTYLDLTPEIIDKYKLIINCTPLGTYPNTDDMPELPIVGIGPSHYLFDLVYNPPLTEFLKAGEAQGAVIKNGADMLAIQAEESWRIWNNDSL